MNPAGAHIMRWTVLAFFFVAGCAIAIEPAKPTNAQLEDFENKVRPLLAEHCYSCHGPKKSQAGLRLDTAAGVRKGSDDGAVVVGGDVEKSRLIHAIRRTGEYAMPPDAELSKSQIKTLEDWVSQGAVFPEGAVAAPTKDPRTHWAFQVPREPKAPAVIAANPIDGFIKDKLREKQLSLAAPADKRTLARRLFFDLIGLPPKAEELDGFEKDTDPKAVEQLVDQLLASPQYGERWGRYWLDVARFADTKGYVFTEDRHYPFAYTYRDYVIRSFNEDVPFDRFITEQLAADLMPNTDKSRLAGMGFLTVGRRFSNNIHDITDDRIDVVSRGFLGLTVSCARCHDHKFDPIPTADYYSLYGIFASSHEPEVLPQIGESENTKAFQAYQTELKKRTDAVGDEQARINRQRLTRLQALTGGLAFQAPLDKVRLNQGERESLRRKQNAVEELKTNSPDAPPHAMVMVDNDKPTNQVIFVRGNPNNPGAVVPRQMPKIVTAQSAPFTQGSGRLDMAKAMASKSNPLTARVIVNRVWMWHFGQGLVRTPSDFGLRSDAPTHPELLDWLALRFMEDGWSIKKLHKRILLSDTYRQSSAASSQSLTHDAENLWLSHQNRKRHDFEALRDSILAVCGQLDLKMFGRSVELFKPPFSKRRSIYTSVDRQNLPGTLRAFDFASPEQHSPQRFQTTVPQQSLFLLNSPFMLDTIRAITTRQEFLAKPTPATKITELYRTILSRNPSAEETALATEYIQKVEATPSPQNRIGAWQQLAQVLLMCNEFAFVD